MDLIPLLKTQHKEIRQDFTELAAVLKEKNVDNHSVIDLAREFELLLKAHLGLEDKLLYPFFKRQNFAELRSLGSAFSTEMMKISKQTDSFFNRFEKADMSSPKITKSFGKELRALETIVRKRVLLEENVLFPVYQQYHK